MNENETINYLSNLKGCQFATIGYISEVTGVKKIAKEFGVETPIMKHCTMQVQFNYSYEKAVNNRLKAIGEPADFESSPLPHGQRWLAPNKVIESADGKTKYIRFYSYEGGKCVATYMTEGRPIASDLEKTIENHKMQLNKASEKQTESGLSEHQVKPFAPKIANIVFIKIANDVINLKH